ncbi:MAG: SDR family NAD(P)-dependent oxidoreductase [Solirubrobacterales bacterium]|nr:SDR family NAD(P)-dependent oxidoreductase [Solirubrobacterales bacterium]
MTAAGADRPFVRRVALVTGASGGIGRAIALGLAGAGAPLALSYGTNSEPAERLALEISSGGGKAIALDADLRDPHVPADLIESVEARLGPVEILVANAGRGQTRRWDEVSADEFDRTLAVNLRAPFLLAQRTLPSMQERGFGRILSISSLAAFTGGIIGPHYAASKAGLHGLTHHLASRAAPYGVTVNTLAPALITETGMLPGDPAQLRQQVPVQRLGRPDEVADLALAVLRNAYITNQVISIDGGMHPR